MRVGEAAGADDRIFIVLAALDAGELIDAQIESIRAQTHEQWRLIARDDGSSDDTGERLARWARHDSRITVLSDGLGRLGTIANFSLLLETAVARGAEWVALSDHDDVWLPRKLELQLACAMAGGAATGAALLVHSDLEVVDSALGAIHPSLLGYQGLRHETGWPLPTLLVQNFVTGCSVLVNRALLDVALPIPAHAVMHDWWLALCAASSGRIEFVPDATLRYRQHPSSQIGAKDYGHSISELLGRTLRLRRHPPDEFVATVEQARCLEARLSERATSEASSPALLRAERLLDDYLGLFDPAVGRVSRVLGMRRLGVARQDRIRDASLKLKLLTTTIELSPDPRASLGPGAARMR